MKNNFIPSLFDEVVLHPAIQHSPATHLRDNTVNLIITKSIIHKAVIFQYYNTAFQYYNTAFQCYNAVIQCYNTVIKYYNAVFQCYNTVFQYYNTVFQYYKIDYFGNKILRQEIIPDLFLQKSYLFRQNIPPP